MARPVQQFKRSIQFFFFSLLMAMTNTVIAQTQQYDIPSQALSSALMQFSSQSKAQVVASGVDDRNITSSQVKGQWSSEQALELLLKNTGLSAQETENGDFVITSNVLKRSSMSNDTSAEEILITGIRENRTSKGATGLELSIKGTPQSISTINRDTLDNFGADDLNVAIGLATGITVDAWETNRTNFTARGFEIKHTQIDGLGLPNDWGIVTGAMDSYGYEKLEVIRGANGLLTGIGNASGTINYVRKRPTNEKQGEINIKAGSYHLIRTEADYSTPITEDGRWAARVSLANEQKQSHLRGLSNDRTFLYGVIDGQIGDKSTLTLGYSYQDANTEGNMWGALVLANSDGTQAEFEQNASTTQDWTFWDTEYENVFAEYTHELSQNWNLKLNYNYRTYNDDSEMLYAYSLTGLDPDTGEGLIGWPGSWPDENESHLVDASINGSYSLFGKDHQLLAGISHATSFAEQFNRTSPRTEPGFQALPGFPYAGNAIPRPSWGERVLNNVNTQKISRFYLVSQFELSDSVNALMGLNSTKYQRFGDAESTNPSDAKAFNQTEEETSPYLAMTLDVSSNASIYASYSDIYQPQDAKDINKQYLDPTKGENYELGIKADWLSKKLLTTFALFTADQKGLSTYAGTHEGQNYYKGMDINSEGVEIEATGQVSDNMFVTLGLTHLKLKDTDGQKTYPWVPRSTLNLIVDGTLPFYSKLDLGLNIKWQSDIERIDDNTGVVIKQASYAVINAYANLKLSSSATLNLNAFNLGDDKHLTSLTNVGYYAAPMNGSIGISYQF